VLFLEDWDVVDNYMRAQYKLWGTCLSEVFFQTVCKWFKMEKLYSQTI
jgi:hypothetical protein